MVSKKHYKNFSKYVNRNLLFWHKRNQLTFDRQQTKTRLDFLSKMKKLWDRLYYSNFVNRIVYPHSSSEHKSYFDLNLTGYNGNLNEFLLFNKYWNTYTEISRKKLPLWNFGAFDKDLLSIKCSWKYRSFDSFPSITRTFDFENIVYKSFFNFFSLLWYLMKLHWVFYALLAILAFFCIYGLFFTVNTEFLQIYSSWKSIVWQYSAENFHLYANNIMSFLPEELYRYFLVLSGFTMFPTGNGWWLTLGVYFDFVDNYLFFFKNYIYVLYIQYSSLISFFSYRDFERLGNFFLTDGALAFKYVIWAFLDILSYKLVYNLFWEWWAENSIYYTHYYFYTGGWKIIYDMYYCFYYLHTKFSYLFNDLYVFGTAGYQSVAWVFKYPIFFFSFLYKISTGIVLEFISFVYHFLFLDKFLMFCYFMLEKIYVVQISKFLINFFSFVFYIFSKGSITFFFHFFEKGDFFPYIWMEYVWQYIAVWLEHIPLVDTIFLRRFGIIFQYNWYVYYPFLWNAFFNFFPTVWYRMPSIVYSYTYSVFDFFIHIIPLVVFNLNPMLLDTVFYNFFYPKVMDFFGVVFERTTFLKTYFYVIGDGLTKTFNIILNVFDYHGFDYISSLFIVQPDFVAIWVYNIDSLFTDLYLNDNIASVDFMLLEIIKPYKNLIIFFKDNVFFSILALKLHHSTLYEWIVNWYASWEIFLFFDVNNYVYDWIVWNFWKTNFLFLSEERFVYILNENRSRILSLDLFLWIFQQHFREEYELFKRISYDIGVSQNNLFLEAYWNIFDSFYIYWEPKKLWISFRRIEWNLLDYSYIAYLREFGYTLPLNRQRLGSLINLLHEGRMEAGYIDYAKEPWIDFYEDWLRMLGGPLYFDLGFVLDISAGMYHHYMLGNYEEEGDLDSVMPAYQVSWSVDSVHQFQHYLPYYLPRIMSDFYIYGPIQSPFAKTSTSWALIDQLYVRGYKSTLSYGISYLNLMVLDSFEDYFRFIYLYNTKDLIFYNLFFEILPFRSLFQGAFIRWRDYFVYGAGFPIGPWDVGFFFDFLFPLFDWTFQFSYYILFLINLLNTFFVVILNGDLGSFVVLYMLFFSETKLITDLNINLYFFFEFFYYLYEFSIWILNVFLFRFIAWNAYINAFISKSSFILKGFYADLNFFETYVLYYNAIYVHEFYNNLYWDEVTAFYSFFDYYNNFSYFDIGNESSNKETVGFNIISNLYENYIISNLDPYLKDNFFYTAEFSFRDVFPLIKFVADSIIQYTTYYSYSTYNEQLKLEEALHTHTILNILIESRFHISDQIDPSKFSFIFREYVLSNFFFDSIEELKYRSFTGLHDKIYRIKPDLFKDYKSDSVFMKWYLSYTHRQNSIYGLWYLSDYIIFILGLIFSFLIFWCIYWFLAIHWLRWDLWRSYLVLLYPGLVNSYSNFKFSRANDIYMYHEEVADVMFEFGDFYFQSADYIYLPYRKFTVDSFLKRPDWLYAKDSFVDFNLNTYFKWDAFFDAKDSAKENIIFSDIQKLIFRSKNIDRINYTEKQQFLEKKNKNFNVAFDFWSKDKYNFEKEVTHISKKFMYYWIWLIFAVFSVDYFLEFHKVWFFKWFFFFPRLFIEVFWSSDLLSFNPYFFDMIFATIGFFYCTFFVILCYFCFCWIQIVVSNFSVLSRNVSWLNNLMLGLISFNIFSSMRFWEQRKVSFNFSKRIFNNIAKESVHFSPKNSRPFDLTDIFERQTSFGWGPLINDSICLNSFLDNCFLHNDLKINTIDSNVNMHNINIHSTFLELGVALPSEISNVLYFDHLNNFLDFQNKDNTRFLNNINLEIQTASCSNNVLFSSYNNTNPIWLVNYFKLMKNHSNILVIDNTILKENMQNTNIISQRNSGHYNVSTLTTNLMESGWDVWLSLKSTTSPRRQIINDLPLKDVNKFLSQSAPKLNFEIKGVDWAHVLKIPIIESHIPDPEFKPDWPYGEYAPNMADYLRNQWRLSWTFFGAGDNQLVYRELIERGEAFVGEEQAWGFVDIHDLYDLSEKGGQDFRREFYTSLYDEKTKRLAFKESWINFDINNTALNVVEDLELKEISHTAFFRHAFLNKDFTSTMMSTVNEYPVLSSLYEKSSGVLTSYDYELAFDLQFGFDYDGLTDKEN